MALNGWDFYNEIVIERTGRTWDTGAPIWPYQVPHLLLVALNAPAWEASVVFDRALGSYSPPRFAGEFFVLTLMLWWFVGLELDCVRTGATARRTGMLATLGFASVAVLAFVWARSSVPTDLRVVGQFVWALCIGSWAALWAGTCWRQGCVLTLPITMGRVSLLLLVWSLRNERVIEHMAMGWDTGAPVWPYTTPQFLLEALNAPAFWAAVWVQHVTDCSIQWVYSLTCVVALPMWWLIGWALRHVADALAKPVAAIATLAIVATGLGLWAWAGGSPLRIGVVLWAVATSFLAASSAWTMWLSRACQKL